MKNPTHIKMLVTRSILALALAVFSFAFSHGQSRYCAPEATAVIAPDFVKERVISPDPICDRVAAPFRIPEIIVAPAHICGAAVVPAEKLCRFPVAPPAMCEIPVAPSCYTTRVAIPGRTIVTYSGGARMPCVNTDHGRLSKSNISR